MSQDNLRTPSPNREFTRVSSRNLGRSHQPSSPAHATPNTFQHQQSPAVSRGDSSVGSRPLSVGAGRFSPAQYFGGSLSRSSAQPIHTHHNDTPAGISDQSGSPDAANRLHKPLYQSQHELREARKEKQAAHLRECRIENNIDYIGLPLPPAHSTPAPSAPTSASLAQAGKSAPNTTHSNNLETEDGVELPPDIEYEGVMESPPPPPPPTNESPYFMPLDQLRKLTDEKDGILYTYTDNFPEGAGASSLIQPSQQRRSMQIASPISAVEEEDRLRRFRRIHALKQDYVTSVHSAIDYDSLNVEISPKRNVSPGSKTARAVAELDAIRKEVIYHAHNWSNIHNDNVEELNEQMRLLVAQRAEHISMQHQLINSEEMLAKEGEKNKLLLEQLHEAVFKAEGRVDNSVLVNVLSKYPASWFDSLSESNTSKSHVVQLDKLAARSRSNSDSGGIYASTHKPTSSNSRSTTPTHIPVNHFISTRSTSSTSATGLLASGEVHSSPRKFRPNAEITARLSDVRSAGRGIYGPPSIEKRYESSCDNSTVITSSSVPSRSGSTGRYRSASRSGSVGRVRGLENSDISTLGGGKSVRSTSASRARTAHILAKNTPPIEKKVATPAPVRFVTGSEHYMQAISTGRASHRLIQQHFKDDTSANVFTASGREYHQTHGDEENLLRKQAEEESQAEKYEMDDHSDGLVNGSNLVKKCEVPHNSQRHQSIFPERREHNCSDQAIKIGSSRSTSGLRQNALTHSPSNSAVSTRFHEDLPQHEQSRSRDPINISRLNDKRRYSIVTNSSDASYSGSRHSDVQWDEKGWLVLTGHRAEEATCEDEMTTSECGEVVGDDMSPAALELAKRNALVQRRNNVYGALIQGNSGSRTGEALWNVSSSSDSSEEQNSSTKRTLVGSTGTGGKVEPLSTLPPNTKNISGDDTNYVSCQQIESGTLATVFSTTDVSPWGEKYTHPRVRVPTASPTASREHHSSNNHVSNTSSNTSINSRYRKPSITPKVKVPVASQAAVTPEAQLRALAVRNAVRAEADDYIASLKRSLKS